MKIVDVLGMKTFSDGERIIMQVGQFSAVTVLEVVFALL
jgi:hypothetical protein